MMQRSRGVKLLSALAFVAGLLLLYLTYDAYESVMKLFGSLNVSVAIYLSFMVLIGSSWATAGIGIWKTRLWAKHLLVITLGVWLVHVPGVIWYNVTYEIRQYGSWAPSSTTFVQLALYLVPEVTALVYVTRPNVRAQFQHES